MLLMYAGDLFVNMMTFASLQRYPSSSSLTCKGGGGGTPLFLSKRVHICGTVKDVVLGILNHHRVYNFTLQCLGCVGWDLGNHTPFFCNMFSPSLNFLDLPMKYVVW